MPMKISDKQISTSYNQLEASKKKIDDTAVLDLLAGAGDSSSKTKDKVLAELSKPGMTRDQQVALVQKGMSKTEKADLQKILKDGTVPMTASARNFIEAVVGQSAPSGNPLKLSLTGDQKNGLAGLAGPGVSIEAINLTTAPGGRLFVEDTVVIGKTDQSGKFTGKLPDIQEGDVIRLRARGADGSVGEWVTVKASGISSSDTRNAVLAIFRIGLSDAGGGKINVANINESRPVSEPGAKVQFTNTRTGEKIVATVNDVGQLPKDLKLSGKAGDTFSVAVSDGKSNTSFSTAVGTVTVPGSQSSGGQGVNLPDPAMHKDELDAGGKPRFSTKRFSGPLFKDGASFADVQQGQLGDCYFPSAMAALAQANPKAIQDMIKQNPDGTYTVTFKEYDWRSSKYKDVPVTVDGDLYVRAFGGPLYGATLGADKGEKTMEMWFPIMEKAYAQWKGSYNEIGNGGMSSDVFEACLGKSGVSKSISSTADATLWKNIKDAVDNHKPASAGTYGEDRESLYTNSGVYADHSYSILGYSEKNGVQYVRMRNPWGESEPSGDGKNDGVFDLTLADFKKYYQTFMSVQ